MSDTRPGAASLGDENVPRIAAKLLKVYGSDAVLIARCWANVAARAGNPERAAVWERVEQVVAEPNGGPALSSSQGAELVAAVVHISETTGDGQGRNVETADAL